MIGLLSFLHVLISIFLIISILLQSSRGGGLAGMFGGGGGMGGMFGGRGAASFLSKVTMWLAIAFAITCLVIPLSTGNLTGKNNAQGDVQSVLQNEGADIGIPRPSGTAENNNFSADETEQNQ